MPVVGMLYLSLLVWFPSYITTIYSIHCTLCPFQNHFKVNKGDVTATSNYIYIKKKSRLQSEKVAKFLFDCLAGWISRNTSNESYV